MQNRTFISRGVCLNTAETHIVSHEDTAQNTELATLKLYQILSDFSLFSHKSAILLLGRRRGAHLSFYGSWALRRIDHWVCGDARPTVTFPAAERHHLLTGTKLYCLVTEARVRTTCPRSLPGNAPGRSRTCYFGVTSSTFYRYITKSQGRLISKSTVLSQ